MTGREYPDVRVWQSTPLARHYFLLVFLPFIPQFVSPSFGSERIDEWLEAVMFASRKHAICSPFVQLFPTRSFLSVPFLDFSTMIYALSVWLRKEGWGRDLMNGCKNRSRDGKHINWVDLHSCSLLVFFFLSFILCDEWSNTIVFRFGCCNFSCELFFDLSPQFLLQVKEVCL